MEELSNKAKEFFEQIRKISNESPQWIYLVIGILFLVLFIGILKNKNWAIDPNSGNQRYFYQTFGRKTFRIVVGSAFLLGSIAGICMFLLYYFK